MSEKPREQNVDISIESFKGSIKSLEPLIADMRQGVDDFVSVESADDKKKIALINKISEFSQQFSFVISTLLDLRKIIFHSSASDEKKYDALCEEIKRFAISEEVQLSSLKREIDASDEQAGRFKQIEQDFENLVDLLKWGEAEADRLQEQIRNPRIRP